MSTPYDTDEELLAENDTSLHIRAHNDAFRAQTSLIGSDIADGTLAITSGVAAHGNDFIDRAVHAVREYSAFSEDNDPYGEHDFGTFEIDGENLFWKIDYYDRLLEWGSPPRRPERNPPRSYHPACRRRRHPRLQELLQLNRCHSLCRVRRALLIRELCES